MTGANYAAWNIPAPPSSDADDASWLTHLTRYAVLAPSGHNTQPWEVTVADKALVVARARARALGYSGPMAGEPSVSLGCFTEVLSTAAMGFGMTLNVDYNFKSSVATCSIATRDGDSDEALLRAITARSSNRSHFDGAPLDPAELARITDSTGYRAGCVTITGRVDIERLAEHTRGATLRLMGAREFRTELSEWVRSNVTKAFDGMPGYTQGMPTAPSLIGPWIVRHIDISRDQALKDSMRVAASPAIALITLPGTTQADFFELGRLFAAIAIRATRSGLDTSGVAAAVIDPASREAIRVEFAIADLPLALVRIGRSPKAARHTPRWPLETVLERPDQ